VKQNIQVEIVSIVHKGEDEAEIKREFEYVNQLGV
jgi:hypothetical protein